MNTIIEIHDSRVTDIIESDGTVVVHFKTAYLHKSEGRPVLIPALDGLKKPI